MIPKYIEKFNLLVDMNGVTVRPKQELIKGISSLFIDNFNGFAADTYIYRGGFWFNVIWALVKVCVPARTLEKVRVVDKGKENEIANKHFDLDSLEEKFGGNLPNNTVFWPPRPERNGITKEYIEKKNLTLFNIFGKDEDTRVFLAEGGGG